MISSLSLNLLEGSNESSFSVPHTVLSTALRTQYVLSACFNKISSQGSLAEFAKGQVRPRERWDEVGSHMQTGSQVYRTRTQIWLQLKLPALRLTLSQWSPWGEGDLPSPCSSRPSPVQRFQPRQKNNIYAAVSVFRGWWRDKTGK